MAIRIYNTLSRKKERFEPVEPHKVRMYVCGPTVYDSCHIGHARSVVVFDVIARFFRERGYDVTYIRNFTDVDDKIISRANDLGVESRTIAEKFINEFHDDMDHLNVERATIEPKATDHIGQIVRVIEKLIEKGNAYRVDNDVFFSVESFARYGKLSGRKLEDMMAGKRVEIDDRKRNPFDFALWKSAKPNEPAWDSPWGKGRPGWHIECSAMSTEYLGQTLDIHGGGKDLIFPHHENEIAQSEGAFGTRFVRYWMHNGFVNINQEKMSKSLGNFVMIKDVVRQYPPEAIRLFLLSNHYRSPIDYSDQAMNEAVAGLDKIYTLCARVRTETNTPDSPTVSIKEGLWEKFCEAMEDDFNTARGIGILFEGIRTMNRLMDQDPGAHQPAIKAMYADIVKIGEILGILKESPETYFHGKGSQRFKQEPLDTALIESLIGERVEARKAKEWEKADTIRKRLEEMNIILEDRPDGTVWKFK
jgi:cysteinyl-tRNA synthetase